MKTGIDQRIAELNKRKVPIVVIDSSLGKYRDNTPFPEKLALAEERLKRLRVPAIPTRENAE